MVAMAVATAIVAGPVWLSAQAQPPDAAKVLADMRAALGGAKVAAVKTLTAEGTIQRVTPRGTVERTLELAVALPDKYVARTQLTDQGNLSVYRSAGFNGVGLINETEAPPNLAAAGVRARLSDRPGGAAPTEEQQAAAAARIMAGAKKEFARLALGLLGSSFDGFPVTLSYAGLAESPDGSAHVIAAKAADDSEARLFVDAGTHMPLMIAWSEPRPANPRAAADAPPAAPTIEYRLYYSNFKEIDGVKLPHTWRRSVDGSVTEETTFTVFQVNPTIDSKKFEISR
jgi:hypothetical protein